jgi:hypothetical protein
MTTEIKKFTVPIDGVPEGWEPAVVRTGKAGETVIGVLGEAFVLVGDTVRPCVILRKKYVPQSWLKEAGFKAIWRDEGVGWYASEQVPEWRDSAGGYFFTEAECCCLKGLNFTPPDFPPEMTDEETLIEL